MSQEKLMEAYKVGDRDQRPWGEYEVTAVGMDGEEEYCEKSITVNPANILSLQSHDLRRETWSVKSGELTVVLNENVITLKAGQDIFIPCGSIHAMANLADAPCIVFERQEGICREEDIKRYLDAYGRAVEDSTDPIVKASLAAYRSVLDSISALQKKTA